MMFARLYLCLVAAGLCLLLVACGERIPSAGSSAANQPGEATAPGDSSPSVDLPEESTPPGITLPDENVPSKPANEAPAISGQAPGEATVGQEWAFQPSVSDPEGDSLIVSATNLPGWVSLNGQTGRMEGTPESGDIQAWTDISVAVTDGVSTVNLAPFSVEVVPANTATGSAVLSWLPPTENVDGTPVNALSGYRVLYGQTPGDYSQTVVLNNPGITSYMVEGLTSGVWYFAIQAIDSSGLASEPSAEASKVI